MDVQYSPEAKQSPEAMLLKQASTLLVTILGSESSQMGTAEWDCVSESQGQTLYRLTIRDYTGEASTEFTREELQNPLHMRFRMYRLCGDLLQVRHNLQHQQVLTLSGAITTN
jgi:hypothetical protein